MKKLGLAIFAGGNRIFYIAGVLQFLIERGLKYDVISTYSSGGAIIPLVLQKNLSHTVDIFTPLLSANDRNICIENLFRRGDVFPHDSIYKNAVEQGYVGFDALTSQANVRIVLSLVKPHGILTPIVVWTSSLLLIAYFLSSRFVSRSLLKKLARLIGVEGKIVTFCETANKEELIELVLGSSTVYPFIHLRKFRGSVMLDGKASGLTPLDGLSDCTDVLAVRVTSSPIEHTGNLYQITPIEKVMVNPLDYTNPAAILGAYKQGYREAEIHFRRLESTPFFS